MRPYQKDFCNAVWQSFEKGTAAGPVTKVLGAAATGAGKTIMASALMEKRVDRGEKCLFIADSDELIDQTAEKLHAATGIFADIEKAAMHASLRSDVVVASIQTLARGRAERFQSNHFRLVIADEAHRSMAPNWQRVLKYYGEAKTNILGITATPERADGIPLMQFYEHLAFEIPLKTLIEARHLSPIMVRTAPLEIEVKGKVNDGEMEDIAEELAAYSEAIIDAIEAHAADRRGILIFHPSRAASRAFSDRLLARGHSARHVDGDSPDRKQIVKAFTRGDFRILNNAQLLTTGFDAPRLDCVIILRPTKSRTAYVQMVGRGTRLFCPHGCVEWCDHEDRKMDMLLLDFMWQFPGMNLMGPANLCTDNKEQAEAMTKRLREPSKTNDLLAVDAAAFGEREELMLKALKRASKHRGMMIDARAFGAVMHQPDLMDYAPTARWESRPASPRQKEVLAARGVDVNTVTNMGQASQLIGFLSSRQDGNMATLKQVMLLREKGFADAHKLTFQEARAAIDVIAEKWRKK